MQQIAETGSGVETENYGVLDHSLLTNSARKYRRNALKSPQKGRTTGVQRILFREDLELVNEKSYGISWTHASHGISGLNTA